ncbi:MAG: MbcA/ParS/Xre antitoxin family protein [Candidatus Eremiobacteraeota bacterium]|nr:MbcA/ParS/Xre antitoxin family protein [Candidatus Eremiobacteraeota bacterium]
MDRASRLAALLRSRMLDEQLTANLLDPQKEVVEARVAATIPTALAAFEAPDIAFVWLTSPNISLGGSIPMHMIVRSDLDAIKVRQVLDKIRQVR